MSERGLNTFEIRRQSCFFSQTNKYSSLQTNQYSSQCFRYKGRLQNDCANANAGLNSWSFNVRTDIFACDTLDDCYIWVITLENVPFLCTVVDI